MMVQTWCHKEGKGVTGVVRSEHGGSGVDGDERGGFNDDVLDGWVDRMVRLIEENW